MTGFCQELHVIISAKFVVVYPSSHLYKNIKFLQCGQNPVLYTIQMTSCNDYPYINSKNMGAGMTV